MIKGPTGNFSVSVTAKLKIVRQSAEQTKKGARAPTGTSPCDSAGACWEENPPCSPADELSARLRHDRTENTAALQAS
jgi:hypothetical protein